MTTTAAIVECPHCQAPQQTPGGFCTACGKALPSAAATGPRTLGQNEFGSSSAARSLRSDELAATAKKAAGALLAVAVIQAIFTTIILAVAKSNQQPGQELQIGVIAILYGIALLFFGLYVWARKNPLPAAIVGLVLFVTMHVLNAIIDPTTIPQGIIMKIVVIAVLVKGIQAGLLHRKLQQEAGVQR